MDFHFRKYNFLPEAEQFVTCSEYVSQIAGDLRTSDTLEIHWNKSKKLSFMMQKSVNYFHLYVVQSFLISFPVSLPFLLPFQCSPLPHSVVLLYIRFRVYMLAVYKDRLQDLIVSLAGETHTQPQSHGQVGGDQEEQKGDCVRPRSRDKGGFQCPGAQRSVPAGLRQPTQLCNH